MRLFELQEPKTTAGLYVAAYFTPETESSLEQFLHDHAIPEPIPADKFHTTIVYSRKAVYWRAETDINQPAEPLAWEVWLDHKKKHILVLKLKSGYLFDRHKLAMDRGASYDFPQYNPHITFSYDVGPGFDASNLPLPQFEIVIDKEIAKPIDA